MGRFSLIHRIIVAEKWRDLYWRSERTLTPAENEYMEKSLIGGTLLPREPLDVQWRRAQNNWSAIRSPDATVLTMTANAAKLLLRSGFVLLQLPMNLALRWAGDIKVASMLECQDRWDAEHTTASRDERAVGYCRIRSDADARFGQVNRKNRSL